MKLFVLFAVFAASTSAFAIEGLKNESEVGVVLTSGNNEVSTISGKQASTYVSGLDTYSFTGRYLTSSNAGVQQALQWGLGLKYDRGLADDFSVFLGQILESNVFQNINQRYATDLGGKVIFYNAEKVFTWFVEGGYRFTRENYPSDFKNLNFLRVYTAAERFWNPNFSGKLGVEYLPNLTLWKAYQLNASASINAAVNSVFSVKTGFDFRYNNEPPAGARSNSDRIFTTALVAKF